jgi:hypothetical protein
MAEYDWGEVEAKLREKGGNLYDPSDLEGIKRNTSYSQGGVDLNTALNNAYGNYDQRRSSDGGGGGGYPTGQQGGNSSVDSGMSSMLQYLQGQQAQQQQERAPLREMLMSQLGQYSQPVDPNSGAMKPISDAVRLENQRSAERQRSQLTARLSADNLADSGTFDTGVGAIEQQRGETNARQIGGMLQSELGQRRQHLTQLLQTALGLNDTEAARAIQAQLNTLQMQANQSNTYDDMGYRYAALQAMLNGQGASSLAGLV